MAVRWDRIDRKLAVIQALLVDLVEDLAVLRAQMEESQKEVEPVAEKKVQRKLRKGEKVELR